MQADLEEIKRLERTIKKNPKIQEKRTGISSAIEEALKGFSVTFVDTDNSVIAFGEMVAVFSNEDDARHYVKVRQILPRLLLAARQFNNRDAKTLSGILDSVSDPEQIDALRRVISAALILED